MGKPTSPATHPRYTGGFSDHEKMAVLVVFDHLHKTFVLEMSYDLRRHHARHHGAIIDTMMAGARKILNAPIIFHG